MKRQLIFVLFLLHFISAYCETPLFYEPRTGVQIQRQEGWTKLNSRIIDVKVCYLKSKTLFNGSFAMNLKFFALSASSIQDLFNILTNKTSSLQLMATTSLINKTCKLITIRYSNISDSYYFQFEIEKDKRVGLIVKKINENYFCSYFEGLETRFISGERIILRFLENCEIADKSFIPKFKPIFPMLSNTLVTLKSNNELWDHFENKSTFGSKSMFYSISDEDNIVYLLASVHAGYANFYPLPSDVENSFESSPNLVFEAIPEKNSLWELRNYSQNLEKYRTGDSLLKYVDEKKFLEISNFVCSHTLGVSEEELKYQKPWVLHTYVSSMMMFDSGIKAQYGVENYFYRIKKRDVAVLGLEEVKYHLSVLDRINPYYWLEDLLLLDKEESIQKLDDLMSNWKSGNLNFFDNEVMNDKIEKDPTYYQYLLKERNRVMTDSIIRYLEDDEDYFVIAGAAHFAGEDSLINMLKDDGFNVKFRFPYLSLSEF